MRATGRLGSGGRPTGGSARRLSWLGGARPSPALQFNPARGNRGQRSPAGCGQRRLAGDGFRWPVEFLQLVATAGPRPLQGDKAGLHSRAISVRTSHVLAKAGTAAVNGIEAYRVEVEVDAGYGDTNTVIIGSISPSHPATTKPCKNFPLDPLVLFRQHPTAMRETENQLNLIRVASITTDVAKGQILISNEITLRAKK